MTKIYSRIPGDVLGRDKLRLSEVEYCINKLMNSEEEGDLERARLLILSKSKSFLEYVAKYNHGL